MTEFNTRLVHGPAQNDNQTGAVNVPIYTSTTYRYPKYSMTTAARAIQRGSILRISWLL